MDSRKTFFGIQVLRGAAALLVIAFHVSLGLRDGMGLEPPPWMGFAHIPVLFFGNSGVDLFFVISGFVIVWTTQDTWKSKNGWRGFLEKRVTRIFPLYWILTTFKVCAVLAAPHLFKAAGLNPWFVIASYLLIPARDSQGFVQPIITAGWTLSYEMFFYYFCAVSLAFRRRPVLTLTPVFLLLAALSAFRSPSWGPLSVLVNPLLLEFIAGMWIAELTRRGMVRGAFVPMMILLCISLAAIIASDWLPVRVAYGYRVLVWGIPAALIVYAVIALEAICDFRKLRFPLLVGDASYSIYLSSVLVLQPVITRIKHVHMSAIKEWAMFCIIVGFGLACGIAVWWFLEVQVIRRALHFTKPMREAWINPGEARVV